MNTTKYRAYNLFATTNSNLKNTQQTFFACVLHAIAWLKQHCNECAPIATYKKLPQTTLEKFYENPFAFNEEDRLTFQIRYEPYAVKAEYDEKNGSWALRLIEPDGFYQKVGKEAKSGRIFITNIAFCIVNDTVECGFKTTVIDKVDNTTTPAKQFAISCVGNIANDKHIRLQDYNYSIFGKSTKCKNSGDIDSLVNYINNEDRKMPVVVMFECLENKLDTTQASMQQLEEFLEKQKQSNFRLFIPEVNSMQIESHKDYLSPDEFANKTFGIAQVFVIPNEQTKNVEKKLQTDIREGSILLYGPREKIYAKHSQYHRSSLPELNCLDENLDNSPIVLKAKNLLSQSQITFGSIKFLTDENDETNDNIQPEKENEIENYAENIARAIIESYPKEVVEKLKDTIFSEDETQSLKAMQVEYDVLSNKYTKLYDSTTRKNQILSEENVRLKKNDEENSRKIEQLEKKLSVINQKDEIYNRLIESYNAKDNRPQKESKYVEWVNNVFNREIIVTSTNFELKDNQSDMKVLCDATEFLAKEYLELQTGKIGVDLYENVSKEKYGKVFDIAPLDETKYEQIKYDINHNGIIQNCGPTLHLRYNNKDKMFRIYFFIDKKGGKIVITKICKHDYQKGQSK